MIRGVLRGVTAALHGRAWRALEHAYVRLRWGRNLPALATHFGSDKWGDHWYAQHYQAFFAPLRRRRLRLLEIGVGGTGNPRSGGASLRMWKAYFPNARIVGIDIYDKRLHDEERIRTVIGSQSDERFLAELSAQEGPFDIVIDDGSHENRDVIRSFEILFPLLAERGFYAVEDLQTSYWSAWGGAPAEDRSAPTSMNFFKALADTINYREFHPRPADWQPHPVGRHIVAMHFYHNLVFVEKGRNDELSNRNDARKA